MDLKILETAGIPKEKYYYSNRILSERNLYLIEDNKDNSLNDDT